MFQFDSPVAQVWKVSMNGIEELSLFDSAVVPTLAFMDVESRARLPKKGSVESLVYLGM